MKKNYQDGIVGGIGSDVYCRGGRQAHGRTFTGGTF